MILNQNLSILQIFYFDLLAKQFIENGTEKNITFDAQEFDFFDFFRKV
jgi:hypothetical protein